MSIFTDRHFSMIRYLTGRYSCQHFYLTLIAVVCVLLVFVCIPAYLMPSEDAAILFSYAENWAKTGVISYYPGGPPAEGSTDFLFLVLVTSGIRLGMGVYEASLLINALATLLTVFFLLRIADSGRWLVNLLLMLSVFFSLQMIAGVYGYGTILFGAFLTVTVYCFLRNYFAALVFAALLTVLCRPDGILMVAPLVLFALAGDKASRRKRFFQLLILGVIPGLLYYSWRLWYFGELFPLPFYVKAQGEKMLGSFQLLSVYTNIHYIRYFLFPLLIPVAGLICFYRRDLSAQFWMPLLSMILIPLAFYSMTQQDMNLGYRYQYPAYLGCLLLIAVSINRLKMDWLSVFLLGSLVLCFREHYVRFTSLPDSRESNYVRVMKSLRPYSGTLAVTDAGYAAWLSRWSTVDLWGLNSPQFSRRLAQPEDIRQLLPDLVEIAPYAWDSVRVVRKEKTFPNLIQNTFLFLQISDYQVWRVPNQVKQSPEIIWHPAVDRIFRANNDLRPGRYDDTITFGIRPDARYIREISAVFEAHQGVRDEYNQQESLFAQ